MYHPLSSTRLSVHGGALRGVTIAEAVSSDHHVVESVVVLLCHLVTGVQQIIAQRVEFDELHSQVCDLQHVCTNTRPFCSN